MRRLIHRFHLPSTGLRCRRFCAIALVIVAALNVGCREKETVDVASVFRVRLISSGSEGQLWIRQGDAVLSRLKAEFGTDVLRVDAESIERRREILRSLGFEGVDFVLCAGPGFERPLLAEAPHHPLTAYLVEPGTVVAPNVAVLEFLPGGAAYVGGVAAALVGGSQVGILTGDGGPWLGAIEAGFVDGFKSRYFSGTVVEGEGVEGVMEMVDAGVTVALYAATVAKEAVMVAAQEAGLRLITVGSQSGDWDPDVVVAAISIDLPESVSRISRDVLDGAFQARLYAFDLGSGVVDLEVGETMLDELGPEGRLRLEDARAAVTAGLVELEQMGL
ncbi:MAG: hypothetical protein K8R59_01965 [Thermoanaerobaculales bacterium]|nr:hypothetical protein [Thermoanaerobaculales bacterium]